MTAELARKGESALVPAHIPQGQMKGLENMRPGDMVVPRLVLMQGLSPLVQADKAKLGDIVNSLTNEVLVGKDETDVFIPIYHYLEWMAWGNRNEAESLIDRSLDANGVLAQCWAKGQRHKVDQAARNLKHPDYPVTEYHNFIVLLPNSSMQQPLVLSCCRSNHKKGRQLLALARYRGKVDLFSGLYRVSSVNETNKKGTYKAFHFENAGWVTEEQLAVAKELYEMVRMAYQNRKLVTHAEGDEEVPTETDEKEM